MTEPPNLPIDKEVTDINVSNNNKIDSNRQNLLGLIDKVIFQNRDTEIIKEFSLTKVTLIDLGADNMDCIQEGLIPLKYMKNHLKD